ncbi:hypothetical protein DIPPA_32679 [Diplonema papillatum]|nr:hypothetical protein DIPPA_13004 [Diplonema papillatum]KAJ9454212.1 hypothetical protein DIPPA_32679 [Diplonema papillatum]|eukprot:gene18385-28349_t
MSQQQAEAGAPRPDDPSVDVYPGSSNSERGETGCATEETPPFAAGEDELEVPAVGLQARGMQAEAAADDSLREGGSSEDEKKLPSKEGEETAEPAASRSEGAALQAKATRTEADACEGEDEAEGTAKATGRISKVTDDDIANAVGRLPSALATALLLLEEHVFFAALVVVLLAQFAKRAASCLRFLSPGSFAAACASSFFAQLTTRYFLPAHAWGALRGSPVLWSILKAVRGSLAPVATHPVYHRFVGWPKGTDSQFRMAQRHWLHEGHSCVYRSPTAVVSPVTWGVRVAVYQAVLRAATADASYDRTSRFERASAYFLTGCAAEVAARLASAPLVNFCSEHSRGQAGALDPWREVAARVQRRGGGWFGGQPSLWVEAPHAGLLLGCFSAVRAPVRGRLLAAEEARAPSAVFRAQSAAVDGACGVAATLFATCATQVVRQVVELRRRELSMDASPRFVFRPSGFLPLADVLAAKLPQAALFFAAFSAVSSSTASSPPCGDGWRGWCDPPAQHAYGCSNARLDSVIAPFGGQQSVQTKYRRA